MTLRDLIVRGSPERLMRVTPTEWLSAATESARALSRDVARDLRVEPRFFRGSNGGGVRWILRCASGACGKRCSRGVSSACPRHSDWNRC